MKDRDFGLWAATAEPAPETPPLPGDRDADIVVVGAGYTGLSTALHAAERGLSAIIVDRYYPGYGASGRNGGQVLPGFGTYPDHLKAIYGIERGEAMTRFGARIADELFDLIARHGIACDARQSGWIHAGHHPSKLAEQRWKHDQWQSRGEGVRWLDRQAIAAATGSEAYVGGWFDERAGTVQPLSLARGLARAAIALGARVHSRTTAVRLERESDGYRIATDRGTVRARHLVLATNGYTDGLLPALRATLVAVESAQVATLPLSDDVLATVLPGEPAVSDTRRSLLYFRRSPDGRLVMGGRGGILFGTPEASYARLGGAIATIFPRLADLPLAFRWAGRLAVTIDHMPHVHEPMPNLIASVGCNGRGVAYSTAMGRLVVQRITDGDWSQVPMPASDVTPMPFAPLRHVGAELISRWYGWRDRLQGAL
jgi:glycine/D-amino acid oxidase-like deaminating enzyme